MQNGGIILEVTSTDIEKYIDEVKTAINAGNIE